MKKTFIPEEFREKYSELLGGESEEFFSACSAKIPKSIWVNSLKIRPNILSESLARKGWKLTNLGFHENAFLLEGVERPGRSEEFGQGLFNLQEKASMIPALALSPKEGELVLDAAAAPGNKTLQMACLMEGKGKIVAVEKNVTRFGSLKFNIGKFEARNVVAKRMDLLDAKKKNLFDKALLDAPCSSEGLVRMKFDALREWSQGLVERKAELQKRLIEKTVSLLKEGGEIVYSTCSLSPEENEEVVAHALAKGNTELLEIKIRGFRTREGIGAYKRKEFPKEMEKCARVLPQDNDSQAFFMAKLRKTST